MRQRISNFRLEEAAPRASLAHEVACRHTFQSDGSFPDRAALQRRTVRLESGPHLQVSLFCDT
jgi:hypothetical protein